MISVMSDERKPSLFKHCLCAVGFLVATLIVLMLIRIGFRLLNALQSSDFLDQAARSLVAPLAAGYLTIEWWENRFRRFDGVVLFRCVVALCLAMSCAYLWFIIPMADKLGISTFELVVGVLEISMLAIGAWLGMKRV